MQVMYFASYIFIQTVTLQLIKIEKLSGLPKNLIDLKMVLRAKHTVLVGNNFFNFGQINSAK